MSQIFSAQDLQKFATPSTAAPSADPNAAPVVPDPHEERTSTPRSAFFNEDDFSKQRTQVGLEGAPDFSKLASEDLDYQKRKKEYVEAQFDTAGQAAAASQRKGITQYAKDKYQYDVKPDEPIHPNLAREYAKATANPDLIAKLEKEHEDTFPIVDFLERRNRAAQALADQFLAKHPESSQGAAQGDVYAAVHSGLIKLGMEGEGKLPPVKIDKFGKVAPVDQGVAKSLLNAFVRGSGNLAQAPATLIGGAVKAGFGSNTANDGNGAAVNSGAADRFAANIMAGGDHMTQTFRASGKGGVLGAAEAGVEMVPMLGAMIATGGAGASGRLFGLGAKGAHLVSNAVVFGAEAGGSYQELYKHAREQGMAEDQASKLALIGGVASGAMNTYLNKFGTLGQGITGSPGVKGRIATALMASLSQGGVGTVQDFVRQSANYVATGKNPEVERLLEAALHSVIAGGLTGAVQAPNPSKVFEAWQKSPKGEATAQALRDVGWGEGQIQAYMGTILKAKLAGKPIDLNRVPDEVKAIAQEFSADLDKTEAATPLPGDDQAKATTTDVAAAGDATTPPTDLAAPTAGVVPGAAEPVPPAKGLPPIPPDLTAKSNSEIRKWAAANGYDAGKIANKGKGPTITELQNQYAASQGTQQSATPSPTSEAPTTPVQQQPAGVVPTTPDALPGTAVAGGEGAPPPVAAAKPTTPAEVAAAPKTEPKPKHVQDIEDGIAYLTQQLPNLKGKDLAAAKDKIEMLGLFLKSPMAAPTPKGAPPEASIDDIFANATFGDVDQNTPIRFGDTDLEGAGQRSANPDPTRARAGEEAEIARIKAAILGDYPNGKATTEKPADAPGSEGAAPDETVDRRGSSQRPTTDGILRPSPDQVELPGNRQGKEAGTDQAQSGAKARPQGEGSDAALADGAKASDPQSEQRGILPGEVANVAIGDLSVDPARFQYKSGTAGAEGVTPLLKGVKTFDKQRAGVVGVWKEPGTGKTWVINGHHRFELAQRTGEKTLNVIYIEAKDAAEARARGAIINIGEGRGTAVDAAKVFRDRGMTAEGAAAEGISLTEGTVRNGLALAGLSDKLFRRVSTGELSEARGVAIGEAVKDHTHQDALAALVESADKKGRNVTNAEIGELGRFVQGAGTRTEETASLFGVESITKSNALEKARLSAWFKKNLTRDGKLFKTVARKANADALREAGSQIDIEKSKGIAEEAATALYVYDKLSTAKGPISDALNKAAADLAAGGKFDAVADALDATLRKELPAALGDPKDGLSHSAGGDTVAFRPEDVSDAFGKISKSFQKDRGQTLTLATERQARPYAEAERVAARFGLRAVFVTSDAPFGAFVDKSAAPDHVVLNVRMAKPQDLVRKIIAHELIHNMKATDEGTFLRLIAAVPREALDAGTAKYLDKVKRAGAGDMVGKLDKSTLQEEGMATIVEKMASDPNVWRAISGDQPSAWERFKGWMGGIVTKLTGSRSPVAAEIATAFERFRKSREGRPAPEAIALDNQLATLNGSMRATKDGAEIHLAPVGRTISQDRRMPSVFKTGAGKHVQIFEEGGAIYTRELKGVFGDGDWVKTGATQADFFRKAASNGRLTQPVESLLGAFEAAGLPVPDLAYMPDLFGNVGDSEGLFGDVGKGKKKKAPAAAPKKDEAPPLLPEDATDRKIRRQYNDVSATGKLFGGEPPAAAEPGAEPPAAPPDKGAGGEQGRLFLPEQDPDAVRVLLRQAFAEISGKKKIGRPELANPAKTEPARRFVDVVDELRKRNGEPGRVKDTDVLQAAADRLVADKSGERAKIIDKATKGAQLDDVETIMGRTLVAEAADKVIAGDDNAAIAEAVEITTAWRDLGTEQARAFRQRRDFIKDPAMRMKEFVTQALTEPPKKIKAKLADPSTRTEAKAELVDHIIDVKKKLKKQGIDTSTLTPAQLNDPDFMAGLLRTISTAKATKWDKLYEYWFNAILSAPKTHVTNILGNSLSTGWEYLPQRLTEAAINETMLAFGAGDAGGARFGEFRHIMGSVLPAMRKAASNGLRAFSREMRVFDDDVSSGASKLMDAGSRAAIGGKAGRAVRIPSRLLLAADEMFKSFIGQIEVQAQAYRTAKSEKLGGTAMTARMLELTNDINSPAWQAARDKATDLTFQGKPGPVSQALIAARAKVPGLRYVFPFINTPAKILAMGFRKSPFGSATFVARLAKEGFIKMNGGEGTYTKGKFVKDAAEQVLAWGVMLSLKGLVDPDKDGLPRITGAGATYKETGQRGLQQRATPPMSIRIGDKWVEYGRFEPMATTMGLAVTLLERMNAAKSGKEWSANIGETLQSLKGIIRDKTFLKGMGDLMKVAEDPNTQAPLWASNFAASWVPNVIRSTARESDEEFRDMRVWGKGVAWGKALGKTTLAKMLPIEALQPPASVDLWGRETPRKQGPTGYAATDWLYNVLFPGRVQDAKRTVDLDRMLVNYNNQHPDDGFYPVPPPFFMRRGDKTYYMSKGEYHDFLAESGGLAYNLLQNVALDVNKPGAAERKILEHVFSRARAATRMRMFGPSAIDPVEWKQLMGTPEE